MSAKLTDWWPPPGKVPFLILQGANDQAAPPQNGQMLKADLGDRATLVNIPGAGHLMVVTKPDAVSKEIVRLTVFKYDVPYQRRKILGESR